MKYYKLDYSGDYCVIIKSYIFPRGYGLQIYTGGYKKDESSVFYGPHSHFTAYTRNLGDPSQEEIMWLEACIKAGKLVERPSLIDVMKPLQEEFNDSMNKVQEMIYKELQQKLTYEIY